MEITVGFLLCVAAFIIYSRVDNTKFKQCLDQYLVIKNQNISQIETIKIQQEQIDSLRTQVLKYRTDCEEIQEHMARIRKGQRVLQRQHEILRAETKTSRKVEVSIIENKSSTPQPSSSVKELLRKTSEQVREF